MKPHRTIILNLLGRVLARISSETNTIIKIYVILYERGSLRLHTPYITSFGYQIVYYGTKSSLATLISARRTNR